MNQIKGEHESLVQRLKEDAIRLCPDYPDVATVGPFEHVWALSTALEGTRLACDDWHEFCKSIGVTNEQIMAWHDSKKGQ
jgi:hypothetical protein